uniref:Uncharacterized protein n=1 Tax=Racemicystis crocea TaxID=1707966 RepID=A0A3S7V0I8_9BACT|nr:hypothetical protein [Racemicystis crocea]
MGDEADQLPLRDEPPESEKAEGERKRLFERAIPEILKRAVERAVESGATRLAEGPENLRHFVQDLKLPKEALHYLYTQIDDTKNGLYRVVAKEIRDVLEHTQFADELVKVLTKLSFEIKTEIRFIPNDAAVPKSAPKAKEAAGSDKGEKNDNGDKVDKGDKAESEPEPAGVRLPKPDVTAQISVKDRSKDARRS